MKACLALILAAALLVSACAGGADTYTAGRTLGGGAIGAGSGALIGAAAGSAASGALIGGGAGILGGYLYDQYMKSRGGP